jgi:ribonuclease R
VSGADTRVPAAQGGRVAVIERRGKFMVAEPFFDRGPRLVVSRSTRAGVGDLVVVGQAGSGRADVRDGRADGRDGRGGVRGGGRATVVRRIGRPDVARDVIEALMVDRGLRRGFDPAVEREARAAAASWDGDGARGSDAHGTARKDLRSLPTFTIDPVSARDFDDAISASALDSEKWRVWVHIADVSAFVPPRSLVDREAYRRGTSVYVPGAVEPMLPQALSNDVCSLVPGQDRLAVTVEMTVTAAGLVSRPAFYRSLIRSDARLDYDQVDSMFAAGVPDDPVWSSPLAAARAAAGALGALRARRGGLVVDSAEPEFTFDSDGSVASARPVPQTESHTLIEHLMIAANERVAGFLDSRRIPALFRVHERPEGASVQRLVAQLASLGVPTPPVPGGHLTPQQAGDLVGEISQAVDAWVSSRGGRGRRALTTLVLRSMKQAYYDPRNLGHAGLGSTHYCHFTSPIRRYPDLVCHRALLSALDGSEPAPDASFVGGAGAWASAREREAMMIERDADDVARCFLLERQLRSGTLSGGYEHVFDGEVIGLIGAGAFVAFGDSGYQGLLPVRRLRGEWWEINELATMLVGTREGGAIRLGDPVRVQVGQIDAPRGRVDLLPVEV